MLKRLLLPLIVMIVGLSAWTIAQDKQTVVVGPSILKALPKNTTGFIHAPSLASIVRDFKNSPIYKLKDKQEFTELSSPRPNRGLRKPGRPSSPKPRSIRSR